MYINCLNTLRRTNDSKKLRQGWVRYANMSKIRFSLFILGLCVAACIFMACERKLSDHEPPLRPLIYTELPPSSEDEAQQPQTSIINIAPEDLGYALFHALIDHNREAYETMFVAPDDLAALVHMKAEPAAAESARILKDSELMWTLFSPQLASEDPMTTLSTRLRLAEFRIGKGRNLAGKVADPELDDVMQHWGNDLRIELVGTEKIFSIRVPKIVKTAQGWRIAQPIDLDPTLRTFLETGMYLKNELMTSEHYPYPLEVGNFWKYKVDQPHTTNTPQIDENGQPVQDANTTITDMVTDIAHHDGFWIVTFERTTVDAQNTLLDGAEKQTFSWLITPKMIFPCARDCRNNADNIGYLLGYIAKQTPFFVFPVETGNRWTVGGRRANYNRYEVREKLENPLVLPSGTFNGVLDIFGSIEEGREDRFFEPGIGIVQRNLRSSTGLTQETLIKYRLIL